MKKYILTALIAPALALGACQSDEQKAIKAAQAEAAKAAEMAALATCPAEDVIKDVSVFPQDMPDPELENAAWLEANGKRNGVITTASGLQYSIVKSGNENGPSPVGSQNITVNYQGFFKDGKVFDSSYARGEAIDFPANGVIKGWIEGLGLMKPCDAWTLYIPSDMAYGSRPPRGLPADALMIFHVQLLGIDLSTDG